MLHKRPGRDGLGDPRVTTDGFGIGRIDELHEGSIAKQTVTVKQ